MSLNPTTINYLTHTWNPVTGCTFGCPECWARERAGQMALNHTLKPATREAMKTFMPTFHPGRLDAPSKRKKRVVAGVCLMGDLFSPELDPSARDDVHWAMLTAKQHTYILLTKRPELMAEYYELQSPWEGDGAPEVYLGFSARNQTEFDAGMIHMAKIQRGGWKIWVSLEPMHGPIDLSSAMGVGLGGAQYSILSGVILGGQSGRFSPPLMLDWVKGVRDQCATTHTPFNFKQWGEFAPSEDETKMINRGTKQAGRILEGKTHDALAWTLNK